MDLKLLRVRSQVAMRGTVTAIRGGLLQIATRDGVQSLPAVAGIGVGDTVRVQGAAVVRVSGRDPEVYFL